MNSGTPAIPSNLAPSRNPRNPTYPRLPQSLEDWLKKRLMDLTAQKTYAERMQSLRHLGQSLGATHSFSVLPIRSCQNELCSH